MTQKQKTKYYFIAGMWSLDVVPSKKWCRNGLRSEKKTTSWPQNMKVYELVGNENGKMLWKMGKLLPKKYSDWFFQLLSQWKYDIFFFRLGTCQDWKSVLEAFWYLLAWKIVFDFVLFECHCHIEEKKCILRPKFESHSSMFCQWIHFYECLNFLNLEKFLLNYLS